MLGVPCQLAAARRLFLTRRAKHGFPVAPGAADRRLAGLEHDHRPLGRTATAPSRERGVMGVGRHGVEIIASPRGGGSSGVTWPTLPTTPGTGQR